MSQIIDTRPQPGDWVRVRTADDKMLVRRALSTDISGHDFPIVWVCGPDEYLPAHHRSAVPISVKGRRWAERPVIVGVPWPVEDVWVIEAPEASNQESRPQ